MGKSKSNYVVVATRQKFSLGYPRHLWEKLTPDERKSIVARQAALLEKMDAGQAKKRARKRSKVAYG